MFLLYNNQFLINWVTHNSLFIKLGDDTKYVIETDQNGAKANKYWLVASIWFQLSDAEN